MQPQSFNTLGGFKAQGRDQDGAKKIMDDARAIEQAGAFSMVIEGVARGDVKATAAQVSMIKEILAQSKEETAATARGARGVILLPTQGAGPTARLDQQMREQIRAIETKSGDDSKN